MKNRTLVSPIPSENNYFNTIPTRLFEYNAKKKNGNKEILNSKLYCVTKYYKYCLSYHDQVDKNLLLHSTKNSIIKYSLSKSDINTQKYNYNNNQNKNTYTVKMHTKYKKYVYH